MAGKRVNESGNAIVIVLVALIVVLGGAGAYVSMNGMPGAEASNDKAETAQVAASQPASGEEAAQAQAPEFEIKQGNPTVAKIGDKEIKRVDVLNYIQKLPPQMQQLPAPQLFPLATVQVVNAELIGKRAANAKLDNDPAVKQQLAAAKDQIVRQVFVQKEVDKALTDERIKQAYEAYKTNFPKIEEVKARHILVKEEAEAKDVLKKLKDGGDFAALAKEHSFDTGTKEKGGQLAYVAENEVVPEFAKAAFAQEIGKLSAAPVKSQFGYHIIEVQDKRNRPVPEFEQAKLFLASQLRNVVLEEVLQKWRAADKVEVFDINGDAFEPAAGEEAPAEEKAE